MLLEKLARQEEAERLKKEHLARLQKLAKLRDEVSQNESNDGGSPTQISPILGRPKISPSLTGAAKEETAPKSTNIQDVQPRAANRAEVLNNYKQEHKRMREQMKARLKAEYMERLRRERAAKKRKSGESQIAGEGKNQDSVDSDGAGPALMGALGMKSN